MKQPYKKEKKHIWHFASAFNLRKNNGSAEFGSDSDDPVYTLICKNTSLKILDEVKVKSLP